MSLLDKAKKTAKAVDDQEKKAAENEIASRKYLSESLEKITKGVFAGLKEFHGVKTKRGTLKLVRKRVERGNTVGSLRLTDRPNEAESIDLLIIDAAIESGERDYADDCRNIPYTEAVVSIYVKNPPTDERFSYAPTCNYAVRSLGLTTYFGEYVRNWDDNDLPKKLEKVAEWLAPLFRE